VREIRLYPKLSTVNIPDLPLKLTEANSNYCRLGRESRDMGLFKDDDGKGYLLTEDVCSLLLLSHSDGH
jgi:hypothetical protein